jgi:hypothetical protein
LNALDLFDHPDQEAYSAQYDFRVPVVYNQENLLAHETGQGVAELTKLIAPMLARFMATDRVFAKIRRATQARSTGSG